MNDKELETRIRDLILAVCRKTAARSAMSVCSARCSRYFRWDDSGGGG